MSRRTGAPSRVSIVAVVLLGWALAFLPAQRGWAQFRNSAVGGIAIDASGVVSHQTVEARRLLYQWLKSRVRPPSEELARPVQLRLISLRALETTLQEAGQGGYDSLPEEIRYLAGIQRLEYVFLDPQRNDIILAGPGEGWRVDESANVVGLTTGRPVLLLEDLVVALRSVQAARQGAGISCSIDPTAEGRRRFQQYIRRLSSFRQFNRTLAEQALGRQQITITGVPEDSHFARVLVAADYWMKRYAMGLDRAPVDGLPSFLQLLKQKKRVRLDNAMPRWWLACNYEPVARSEDGLTWQLRGPGVQAMTEDDLVSKEGTVTSSGRKNPVAQQWAELMTARYGELSRANAVFGQLRNLMDLCVVAALMEKEGMLQRVGLELPLLAGDNRQLLSAGWHAPKTVDSRCTFLKVGRQYVIAASGGVQIDSWAVAGRVETDRQIGRLHERATTTQRNAWWWN